MGEGLSELVTFERRRGKVVPYYKQRGEQVKALRRQQAYGVPEQLGGHCTTAEEMGAGV